MKESYLVPDYFPKFACKMGECRHPCCKGWPISISTDDYFRLLSVSCGPAMRERLDNAVRVSLHPTPEAYAQIAPTWAGDCPLHLPDGRCSVHAMLGADALPAICRLYPRGIRVEDGNECSCANSCEAVIELMMGQKEPIRFVRADLELNPPKAAERAFFFETVGKAQRIRLYFIEIMQRRAFTLPQRLMTLGEALRQMDAALRRKDEARVEALLGSADGREERYARAAGHLDEVAPDWPIFFEHALVNHMFFEQFPFQDRDEGLLDEFVAICAVYAVLRVLCVCTMANHAERTALADVMAAAFRFINHTASDRCASHMLREIGCADEAGMAELITL